MSFEELVEKSLGLHKTNPDSSYDPAELKMGIEVEMEHTRDRKIAKQIAKHHLDENPHYYSDLKACNIDPEH